MSNVKALQMQDASMFIATCGIVYGAYALYAMGGFVDAHRDEIRRKELELAEHIREGGARALIFRVVQPLFWLVALPIRSVVAALGFSAILILPALLFR